MTAAAIVRSAIAAGVRMWVDGDSLMLSAPACPDARIIHAIRTAKPEVLDYLKGLALWDENDWTALHDERAGILEFDGGLSRDDADVGAAEELGLLRSLVRFGDG